MRKIRDVLYCLLEQKKSIRATAVICNVSRKTASDYQTRFRLARLSWPLNPELDDEKLELELFPKITQEKSTIEHEIDYSVVHLESKQKGFTLQQMYKELVTCQGAKNSISYSHFCKQYNDYKKTLKLSLKHTWVAGEVAMVDYAGQTMPIFDPKTGEKRKVQIFVGVLASSGYAYCEATNSQSLEDWVGSHTRMLDHFEGTPELVVHDNLKAAVIKPHRYAPLINESYLSMCRHYNIHPLAARVYRPKDKAKVELTVQIVTRSILFVLRKRKFFSIDELNVEIKTLLSELNHRPFKQLPGSRYSNWLEHEKPKLRGLPTEKFEHAVWAKVRASENYRINVDEHFYSVPSTFRNLELTTRMTKEHIEIFSKGKRVASHNRSEEKGGETIDPNHQPPSHRVFDGWNKDQCLDWAAAIGDFTKSFMQEQLKKINNKNFGFRAQGAMKKIASEFGNERLEGACKYALSCSALSIESLRTILSRNLDSRADEIVAEQSREDSNIPEDHENLRGASYYKNLLNNGEEDPC
ncbi:MAG: IS21 family transposase [Undibacterium umbellatum]|uniref:IS21 family transposase n=1 Tax=Undibacterium umbellatum TaxID=2762300 RepID=UPI003BB7A777